MRPVLIFDLSEVLIEGLYGVVEPLATRLRIPQETVLPGLGGPPLVALVEGQMSEAMYWHQVLTRTQWSIATDELGALARAAFQRPVPGMPELLASLQAYRLVLLSDHGKEWWEYIEATHRFLAGFERRFLSFEMGRTKRQVETFQHVLAEVGCAAHECLFIDDSVRNVERAESVGIRAHQFRSVPALREWFAARGIVRVESPAS
ncbi:MAG: HAD-IA family hydrolase [Candidatus Latescibacteria bacterium]|nr:HAD-IA family hydrolase [Candidatus Latescibacterota bacterium]